MFKTKKISKTKKAPPLFRAPTQRQVSLDTCACDHEREAHGGDAEFLGSTACTQCDCVAYERNA